MVILDADLLNKRPEHRFPEFWAAIVEGIIQERPNLGQSLLAWTEPIGSSGVLLQLGLSSLKLLQALAKLNDPGAALLVRHGPRLEGAEVLVHRGLGARDVGVDRLQPLAQLGPLRLGSLPGPLGDAFHQLCIAEGAEQGLLHLLPEAWRLNPSRRAGLLAVSLAAVARVITIDGLGIIKYVGRQKDVIRRGGVNIDPLEVERVLVTHPAIRDVAVVGVPDERLGERAAAVVVPHPGPSPTLPA